MKKIVAIIRPNKYFLTKKLLAERDFMSMSAYNVLGHGKKRLPFEPALGDAHPNYDGDTFLAKKWIEIFVRDEDKERAIQTIIEVNSTGSAGDGKIFVLPVTQVVRIRTGEINENALM